MFRWKIPKDNKEAIHQEECECLDILIFKKFDDGINKKCKKIVFDTLGKWERNND
jgi:hypothetical protein